METTSRTSLQVQQSSYVPNEATNVAFFEHKSQSDNEFAENNASTKKRSAYFYFVRLKIQECFAADLRG